MIKFTLLILLVCMAAFMPLAAAETTLVEGTVRAFSALPQPEKSDYPNCYFTIDLEVKNILRGAPVPRRLLLIAAGFRNRKAVQQFKLSVGGNISCEIIPFDQLDESARSVQQADDLQLLDLEPYFAEKLNWIGKISDVTGPLAYREAIVYDSPYREIVNPPQSAAVVAGRKAAIAAELAAVNAKIAKTAGREEELNLRYCDFIAAEAPKMKNHDGYLWGKQGKGLFALRPYWKLMNPPAPDWSETLERLKEFNRFLLLQNVQLIVVPMPNHMDVALRSLFRDYAGISEPFLDHFCKDLLENDIEVIYVLDEIVRRAGEYDHMFLYRGKNDHPDFGGNDVAAELTAKRLERFRLTKTFNPREVSVELQPNSYGMLSAAPRDLSADDDAKPFTCQTYLFDGKAIAQNGYDKGSPVLIVANSFAVTPVFFGYPADFARHAGVLPDFVLREGNKIAFSLGSEIFLNHRKYLTGKKVLVLMLKMDVIPVNGFIDLKKLDSDLSLLAGRKQTGRLDLPRSDEPGPLIPEHLKSVNPIANLLKADRELSLELALPASVDLAKDSIMIVDFFAGNPLKFKVDDAVQAEHPTSVWRKLYFRVPAGRKKVEFRIRADKDTVVYLKPEILFFQY